MFNIDQKIVMFKFYFSEEFEKITEVHSAAAKENKDPERDLFYNYGVWRGSQDIAANALDLAQRYERILTFHREMFDLVASLTNQPRVQNIIIKTINKTADLKEGIID